MNTLSLPVQMLGLCVTVAILAGCGGSQTAMSGALPQVAMQREARQQSSNCPPYSGGSGILSDGDFSQVPEPGGDGDAVYYKGQVFAPSWEVSKGNIDVLSSNYWNMDGLCSVDLDGYNMVGGIEASAFATRHRTYTLSFLLSGNGDCPPTVKSLKVTADRQFTTFTWNISGGNSPRNGDFATERWKFKAGSLTTLKFDSQDPPDSGCGPVVAAISVTQN